ncbi:MAG: penicillin-insensitive murein endopeptidase [Sandaracinaceae bacterium]
MGAPLASPAVRCRGPEDESPTGWGRLRSEVATPKIPPRSLALRVTRFVVLAMVVVVAPRIAEAQPEEGSDAAMESASRSIGVPDRGRLRNGVALTSTPALRIREGRSARYGTAELVGLLRRSARAVHAAHPGPRLLVGDLSRERGGHLRPHRSHRSGRDADVSFYLTSDDEPVEAPQFVNLRRDGCGTVRDTRYCFDAPRNWALLAAMMQDPETPVQYVLVARDIRRRLLAEGERQNAPPAVMERVRIATEPHGGSASHRSHFHVRVYCPVDDRPGCVDDPPLHDWYIGEAAPRPPVVRRMRQRQRRVARVRAARQARRERARAQRRRARTRRQAARRRAQQRRQRAARQRNRRPARPAGGDAR